MSGFELGMTAKHGDPKADRARVRKGTQKGMRKALAFVERFHKKRYMKAGGGAKSPKPPQYPFIMTRTGLLKKSYRREFNAQKLYAAYGSDLKYAKFIEEGSRAHTITAGKGKAIPVHTAAGLRFFKSVRHPGIKARYHMYLVEKATNRKSEKFVADSIAQELSRG